MTEPVARRLVLLRHAKAEAEGQSGDELRALALTGRSQAAQVGSTLRAAGLHPDLVLCSPAVRTRQTWELVRQQLADDVVACVEFVPGLYAARPGDVLDLLHGVDDQVRTVLVVGHEPTMSTTAGVLASEDSDETAASRVRLGVPTATFAVLAGNQSWARWGRGNVTLTSVVQPGD